MIYGVIGAFVGLVVGYILAALMAASNRDIENENLRDYCNNLEEALEKQRKLADQKEGK